MNKGIALTLIVFALSVGISAQNPETMTVKVYFHNEKLNPNQEDCRKVYPTTRTVPKTSAVARAAVEELFKGTTDDERKRGFWSFPADDTRDIIKTLNIKNKVAFLDFKKVVFEKLGNTTSSCGGGFYPSIEATLKQFPSIREVVFAVDGSTNDFYEWVQVGECPFSKRICSATNFK